MSIYNDFLKRRSHLSGLPVELGIEITNRCNLECPMCAREEMTRPTGDMSLELLKKIIDEIEPFAEMVYLHGDGEPCLHKNIYEALAYVKKKGLKVGISTNATTLNENNAKMLIDSKIDYLIVALDGLSKETYEKIRVKGNFEKVVENVKNFLELKQKMRSKIFTAIQFIEMDENKHESKEFVEFWKAYNPNVIRIKPLVNLINRSKVAQFKMPCFYLWRQTMIDWDGTVFPCCVDTNSDYSFGNIANESLAEIWNSKSIQNMREMHIQSRQNEIDMCNTCDMPQLNNLAILGASLMNGFKVKKILPYYENVSNLYRGAVNNLLGG
ncbi:hypothetical protein MNBD_NITROSPINAE02-1761 [hydrothermal vent metagenome]|uniref:Radical SAM core domain-containing protein n=1 Tax=hydrothermal vent metagenome TaxID=652676 RepID=A0A3B1C6I0_9ZZZZ